MHREANQEDNSPTFGLCEELDRCFKLLKVKARREISQDIAHPSKESTLPTKVEDHKRKKTKAKVVWVDQVGQPLVSCRPFTDSPPTMPIGKGKGNGRRLPFTLDSDKRFLEVNRGKGKSKDNENRTKRTYKEVLLLQPRRIHPPTATFQQCPPPRHYPPRRHVLSVGRCFHCLAKDHRVKECRDPIRCSGCFKTGHLVQHCRKCGPLSSSIMHRAMQFRPPSRKVFVPITEGFHTR